MENVRPTWAEVRVIFFPTGILAVIALAAWADSAAQSHLWSEKWFRGFFGLAVVMAAIGLYGFVAHWRFRSIPVVLLALTAGSLLSGLPPWATVGVFSLAFVLTMYFVSPDRSMPPFEARKRDAQALTLTSESDASPGPIAPLPLIQGFVKRFEPVEQSYVSQWSQRELREMLGREPNYHETFVVLNTNPQGPWFIAWLQLEAIGTPSKAEHWRFSVQHKDGAELPCKLYPKNWGPPKEWSAAGNFDDVTEVQNSYLQPDRLYNVLLHIQCASSSASVNMNSFKVRFQDKNGTEVVCPMLASQ